MIRRVSRAVRSMSWLERYETAMALLTWSGVEIGLRLLRLPMLARCCGVGLSPNTVTARTSLTPEDLPAWARRRLAAVLRIRRHWPRDGSCLRASLVLGQRLRRLGPTLSIGVRKEDGLLQAHAWIELGGGSIDATSHQFQPLGLSS